jgi:hypothetical protein
MRLTIGMTVNALTRTLRWIGMQADLESTEARAPSPQRFSRAAREAARRKTSRALLRRTRGEKP